MDLAAALRAVSPSVPQPAIDGLEAVRVQVAAEGALDNALRAAHLIGQCAHESMGFKITSERLSYSSGARIFAVFGRRHFRNIAHADQFARNPEKLANHVYANRIGNGDTASGDGFRFRGRGYLQLTGRSNYRNFGNLIGADLEANPEQAEHTKIAWRVAAKYLAIRKRQGRTALQWADEDNVEMVTRIVNGGINGLEDRHHLTALAVTALGGADEKPPLKRGAEGPAVLRLQHALSAAGFSPGPLDGDFGPKTERALRRFQAASGLPVTGRADAATWAALDP